MNEKYYLGRSIKQIENINEELILLRTEKDKIINKINNLACIRDLLKEVIKKNE